MKALILSGGKGTRLQPITNTNAKQLVPIANKPVLFYVLETIVAAGITDIGIIVGDTHAEIKAAAKDGKQFGPDVSITYIHQEQPLGLAHAVKIAQPFLQEEKFAMFLGDNFIEEDISGLIHNFSAPDCPCNAQILLKQVPHPQQFGVAQLRTREGDPVSSATYPGDERVYVSRLVEKPQEPISDLAIIGIYLFDSHIFEAVNAIEPSRRGELEITDAIQYLIDHHFNVRPHLLTGYWIDTGKMQDMLEANRAALSHIQTNFATGVQVDEDSQVLGEVVLENGARLTNSIVRGPSIIGRNVRLINTYVGPFTSIAQDSLVENSEIEHSIVLEGCHIRDIEGRIEDSLIGRHAQVYPSSNKPRAYKLLLGDHSRIGVL
ncbi:glucose-1-phosphate thymidylyltransferase [Ktedonobacter sp. SOSP1-52]|uniref:glucose-1-phosphate thymidylyltransferase n=1 Tax=Ktedonobacter sp. SOSP1-52 TaxID=2778366 RepID=UPI0019168471|nr:glucose-1-phosphate thymidylyltransferase [Ktedonobacter sp. SOSP1-52]GHO65464.1 glucose-1-phosphate thymidylyltransferase [Ktedonobacter sp. SOSP1-52]